MPEIIRVAAGQGMDGRYESQSPWVFLQNMRPENGRLVPIPGWVREPTYRGQNPTGYGSWQSQVPLDVSKIQIGTGHYALVVGLAGAANQYILVQAVDPEGQRSFRTIFNPKDNRDSGILENGCQAAALGNRVFFTGGNRVYCAERDAPPPDGYATSTQAYVGTAAIDNERGLRCWAVDFGAGVDAANQPYVSGQDFGAPIMESHLGRLFFAGWDRSSMQMDKTLSDSELTLLKSKGVFSLDPVEIELGSQHLVWTDPNNPFSIALGNFNQVQSRSRIKALCSHKDTLFIFCEDEIWTMTGLDETQFAFRRVSQGIGIDGREACVSTDYGVAWSFRGRYYMTDGNDTAELGIAVRHLPRGEQNCPVMTTNRFARAAYSSKTRTVYFGCQSDPQNQDTGEVTDLPLTQPNCLAFDFLEKAWYAISAPRNANYDWDEGTVQATSPFIFEWRGQLHGIGNVGVPFGSEISDFTSWFTMMDDFTLVSNAPISGNPTDDQWENELYLSYYAERKAISREIVPETFQMKRVGAVNMVLEDARDGGDHAYPCCTVVVHSNGIRAEHAPVPAGVANDTGDVFVRFDDLDPRCIAPVDPTADDALTWADAISAGAEASPIKTPTMAFSKGVWIEVVQQGFPAYETWAHNQTTPGVGIPHATIAVLEMQATDQTPKRVA